MAEIAKLTNVSQPTVSRVLNGNPCVNPEIRERVLACAKEHDYQPNALAKGMKGNKTMLLGVLLTDISNGFFADLTRKIEAATQRRGYSIILFNSDYDVAKERACMDVMRRYRVDGILAVPIKANLAAWPELGRQLDIPVVSITRRVEGLDSIYLDHVEAGEQIARHLIEQGYEDFLFVGEETDNKYIGFRRALAALRPDRPCAAVPEAELPALLDARGGQNPRRLGLFVSNDVAALPVLSLLHERGLSIPEQVGVMGFDNTYMSQFLSPRLSSAAQPIEIMAERAVERLLYRIDHPDDEQVMDESLLATLVVRESTR